MSAILIVEDDESLRLVLADNLEDEGYAVTVAPDGASAAAELKAGSFDLIVLDLMLPDTDGYSICRDLRSAGNAVMILMLTARTLEEDLVRGFEAGADDYLAKPYRLGELLARVKALLRRAHATPKPAAKVERFGAYRIDAAGRRVTDEGGRTVDLTRTEFDLLALLVANTNEALTRDRILNEVWGADVVVEGRTVDNFVSSLKKKLHWKEGAGFAIRTVRGVGYRMEIEC